MSPAAPMQCMTDADNRAGLMGLATLMTTAYAGIDINPIGARLLERAAADPKDANALMDLSTLLQIKGDPQVAAAVQTQALEAQQLYRLPATGHRTGIRLLAIMTPGNLAANTPLEFLVEDSDIALDMLYVGPGLPFPESIPAHDVAFIAVCEADENRDLLQQLSNVTPLWPQPLLNHPQRILGLSRDGACALLDSVPGVSMPLSVRINRQTLEQIGRGELSIAAVLSGEEFPVIVRPVGSHAGRGLSKPDHPADVSDYLRTMAENEFYVAPFVDYRGRDDLFRKYRIVLIEGRPFACHMAISEHWMVHYLNAGMSDSADKRSEEARWMANFDRDFARRHEEALRAINERMGLDYLGIDCGETRDGELLIFEVDSGAVVHAMDSVDTFPYKKPQMRKVFAAFREMLAKAIKRGTARH
jgi:hypothetical protein